jgi:hypothetical protein
MVLTTEQLEKDGRLTNSSARVRWLVLRAVAAGRPIPVTEDLVLEAVKDQVWCSRGELQRALEHLERAGLVELRRRHGVVLTKLGAGFVEHQTPERPDVARPEPVQMSVAHVASGHLERAASAHAQSASQLRCLLNSLCGLEFLRQADNDDDAHLHTVLELCARLADELEAEASDLEDLARGEGGGSAAGEKLTNDEAYLRIRREVEDQFDRELARLARARNASATPDREEGAKQPKTALAELLERHIGRDRIISADAISAALGCQKRVVLDLVADLRCDGVAVCGDTSSGFFIAATAEDLRAETGDPHPSEVDAALVLYRGPNKPTLHWCVKEVVGADRGPAFDSLYQRCRRELDTGETKGAAGS